MSDPGLMARLATKIDLDLPSECWPWLGMRNRKGYGHVRAYGRTQRAHRVIYGIVYGPIPEGLEIDHLCRNRACVNPTHLEAVAHITNIRRAAAAKEQCPRGHAYSEENTRVSNGKRKCRTCHREWERARHARKHMDVQR